MKIADADTESAVRKFMARIPADLPVERVLLYGSRARGDFRPDSDADVAVILRHGADDWKLLWTLTGLAYDVFVDTGIMIQPVPVSSRDWADPDSFPRPSFLRNVAREGVQL
ncbi:MAG: nucleotidyltransferase domain-containing protein [Steroidobacteraceae bacterium]